MKGELGWLTHPYGKGVSKPSGLRVGGKEGREMEDGSLHQTRDQPSFKLLTALS